MTDHTRAELANEISRRAAVLFAGTEYKVHAYFAADELLDLGITSIAGIGFDASVSDDVIRRNTSFPPPDEDDLDEDDTDWDDDDGYVEWSEGDIVDDSTGLGIVLPTGEVWHLSDEKALGLMRGLSTMICHRLTQPWSADDPSTILSRGTR